MAGTMGFLTPNRKLSRQSQREISITRCQFSTPKNPLAGYTITSHASLTEDKCITRMQTFKWIIGLFCPSSHFCGMGVNFDSDYEYEKSSNEFKPMQEVCHVLVNTQMNSCEETKAALFSVGILRESSWSCLSHGNVYCMDKYLTRCLDVEGGAACTGCVQGAQPVKEGNENHCIDIDECNLPGPPVCGGQNSTCENEYLSYSCNCTQGFHFNGNQCTDIEECAEDVCGLKDVCNNTIGGYECHCPQGFYFDEHIYGSGCEDIDECSEVPIICGNYGRCGNYKSGYNCYCYYGYFFNRYDYGSGCREWFFFWDHILSFSSNSSLTLEDLINNNNHPNLTSTDNEVTFIHDYFYDKVTTANVIALAVFDQSEEPVSVVMFRGVNDPFDWFRPENIISSSLWNISPYLNDLIMQYDGYGFEISHNSGLGVTKFLTVSCSATKQCDFKYSSSKNAQAADNLNNASRVEIYLQSRSWRELRYELQLQFSAQSKIDNIQSFVAGDYNENYNSRNTFRSLDFDRQIRNARSIRLMMFRRFHSNSWIYFQFNLQNVSFTDASWFSRKFLSAYSFFNFTLNPEFYYKDKTGGFLSVSKHDYSAQNPCAGEFFWFKIICRNTDSGCGFDWSKTTLNCVILYAVNGTSWAKKNYSQADRIEIYTESMTEAFSFTYPANDNASFDILSLYKKGHLSQNDMDHNLAFRHHRFEDLFTKCNYVKYRLYNIFQSAQSIYNEEYIHQEFVFKCGNGYFDWFTASNLIGVSFIHDLTNRDLVVHLFNDTWPEFAFAIWDSYLISTWTEDLYGSGCAPGVVAGEAYSKQVADSEYNSLHMYCGEFEGSWSFMHASKLEIIVDSTHVLLRNRNRNWQIVFMVEAFSGIHIYNFYKNGSTHAAVPGLSQVQYGSRQFFRHPDLESKIKGTSYIRFSVYNLDKTYVVNEIIFKRNAGDEFEDWFHWDKVDSTSLWDFTNRVTTDGGNLFVIKMTPDGTGTFQRFFNINNFWGSCTNDEGWFVAITKFSQTDLICGTHWANWWKHPMIQNDSLANQPPAFFYSYTDISMKHSQMKMGGKITIEILT